MYTNQNIEQFGFTKDYLNGSSPMIRYVEKDIQKSCQIAICVAL